MALWEEVFLKGGRSDHTWMTHTQRPKHKFNFRQNLNTNLLSKNNISIWHYAIISSRVYSCFAIRIYLISNKIESAPMLCCALALVLLIIIYLFESIRMFVSSVMKLFMRLIARFSEGESRENQSKMQLCYMLQTTNATMLHATNHQCNYATCYKPHITISSILRLIREQVD